MFTLPILGLAVVAGVGVLLYLAAKNPTVLGMTTAGGGSGGSGGAGITPSGGPASPPPANFLTAAQIYKLATDAGFIGDDAITAVAVALAESQGNASAYNPETKAGAPPGKGSFGLWQIYLNVHPEFQGWNLYDPVQNSIAAFSVYGAAGQDFTPWATYGRNGDGIYLSYLDTAQTAAAG